MTRSSAIEAAVQQLYDLNVGVVGTGAARHERPHKPALLLAILDLLAAGKVTADRIPWSADLRERFREYFEKVRAADDQPTPENPFYYLRSDGFWNPQSLQDGLAVPLEHPPTVGEAEAGMVFASLTGGFETLARSADSRSELRDALVSRYFPHKRVELASLFLEPATSEIADSKVQEAPDFLYGRSPAFRRKVLEVYDYQCAACGLRIKLPDADLTFVDGAHLIPFGISRNDHPTNGIALCKNHHWAMDRFLLVPTLDFRWKVSPKLDARRSLGEQALMELHEQPILPPHDDAFRPARDALLWREERLHGG